MMTLVPAYGRDYKSKKAVIEALAAKKDFIMLDMLSPRDGCYINLQDIQQEGIKEVKFRYAALTKVFIHKF